ncbi:hypothetical protein C2G38_2215584 [Gigaspora rosea]|uniref:Uncharacterized protein n=1 Tax=Gigaspora rosea TaxID=44941 RepID=A0A397UD77_9GLOM|nr:hypothetical protein C2G38_2215584 [Gigaspora rosea]
MNIRKSEFIIEKQNLLVLVYVDLKFEFSYKIKNDNDNAFIHFIKNLSLNVSNFDMQRGKDNIQYSLDITSENLLNSEYNFATNLWTNMRYYNIDILFFLIKNHEHVPHMKELLGNVIIIIDDLSFRYQSDNIQEFTTILRKFNPQTFIHVCEKHIIATIYNKTSLKSYCNVKNIQVKKKFIKKYQTKLTQDEIDILISRYLKAGKYIRKLKNGGGTRNISVKKYMTQSTTEVSVKSCSISKFNTLNTLFRNYRQEYKDKNFMDDIIDKFVNKLKILINDEDDKIPSDEKKNCWNNQ